jgi:hypothetical protein
MRVLLLGCLSLVGMVGCGLVQVAEDGGVGGGGGGGGAADGSQPDAAVRGPIRKPADGPTEVAVAEVGAEVAAGECTAGVRACEGLVPLTCADNGSWHRGMACQHACREGACVGVCGPGDRSCNGNIPQICSAEGDWQTAAACPFVCREGACTGVCLPGARQCDAGAVPQTCSADGAWESGPACPFVCSAGLCTGLCKPEDRSCNGAVPQRCTAEGAWQTGAVCPNVCIDGQCAGTCVPNSRQCSQNLPQTCSAAGQWQSGAACPFVCAAGACTGVCVPSTRRCNAGQQQVCDASGAWQTMGTASQQLLVNPAFDAGPTGWKDAGLVGEIINLDDGELDVRAHTPPYLAWLGGYDDAVDELSQTVTIPAGASQITLNFYYNVVTEETSRREYDTLDVFVVSPDGAKTSVAHLSDETLTPTWTRFSVALPVTLAGRTVDIRFVTTTDISLVTSFFVDTVSLDVVGCPAAP